MKRFFAGVVKFIVVMLMIAGMAYAVIRYWDSIVSLLGRLKSLVTGKCRCRSEADDYEDWDE